MAPHSSILAWRIPGTEEPGGLPSLGSHRVRHDWCDLAAAAAASLLTAHQLLTRMVVAVSIVCWLPSPISPLSAVNCNLVSSSRASPQHITKLWSVVSEPVLVCRDLPAASHPQLLWCLIKPSSGGCCSWKNLEVSSGGVEGSVVCNVSETWGALHGRGCLRASSPRWQCELFTCWWSLRALLLRLQSSSWPCWVWEGTQSTVTQLGQKEDGWWEVGMVGRLEVLQWLPGNIQLHPISLVRYCPKIKNKFNISRLNGVHK